eukprot:5679788-Amphidinium_carterae.1
MSFWQELHFVVCNTMDEMALVSALTIGVGVWRPFPHFPLQIVALEKCLEGHRGIHLAWASLCGLVGSSCEGYDYGWRGSHCQMEYHYDYGAWQGDQGGLFLCGYHGIHVLGILEAHATTSMVAGNCCMGSASLKQPSCWMMRSAEMSAQAG